MTTIITFPLGKKLSDPSLPAWARKNIFHFIINLNRAHFIRGAFRDFVGGDQGTWWNFLGFPLQGLQHAEHVQS